MPFIGQDWRSPGEAWIKTTEGWEQAKLRPYRSSSDASLDLKTRTRTDSDSSVDLSNAIILEGNRISPVEFDVTEEVTEDFQPHCFVKTGKSKEFVGCTSLTEAFRKLDLPGAVTDVRRFNYVCKALEILITTRLQTLSASARKIILELVEVMVLHCLDKCCELKTARLLVGDFLSGLTNGAHHCGSPKLLVQHQDTVSNLYDLLTDIHIATPAESSEESLTFLDLPQECLRAILRRLPDHESLMTAAQAHEALDALVSYEHSLWLDLCRFHFSDEQIAMITLKLGEKAKSDTPPEEDTKLNALPANVTWRQVYFELKKFFGLRAVYADMIHICCHCKTLFWKRIGHPCVSSKEAAPSVRVTPVQFVDMLCT